MFKRILVSGVMKDFFHRPPELRTLHFSFKFGEKSPVGVDLPHLAAFVLPPSVGTEDYLQLILPQYL
jgi:hypothetical protein